ncbi:MAG: DUF4177 domain-containing protein [Thermodesulfobacteriota bacterium]
MTIRWGYKTVHFGLKKDGLLGSGFLDEAEIEITLNEYGHGGWELVSMMEVNDGLIAVFKQPLSRRSTVLSPEDVEVVEEQVPEHGLPEPPSQDEMVESGQGTDPGEDRDGAFEGDDDADVGSIRIF